MALQWSVPSSEIATASRRVSGDPHLDSVIAVTDRATSPNATPKDVLRYFEQTLDSAEARADRPEPGSFYEQPVKVMARRALPNEIPRQSYPLDAMPLVIREAIQRCSTLRSVASHLGIPQEEAHIAFEDLALQTLREYTAELQRQAHQPDPAPIAA
jgi:hypothetical protein